MNYTRAQIEGDYAHRTSGVLERPARSVTAMHASQRHEPPSPYKPALTAGRIARGEENAVPPVVDSDGVPKGISTALAKRRAAEGR